MLAPLATDGGKYCSIGQVKDFAAEDDINVAQTVMGITILVRIHQPVHQFLAVGCSRGIVEGRAGISRPERVEPFVAIGSTLAPQRLLHFGQTPRAPIILTRGFLE